MFCKIMINDCWADRSDAWTESYSLHLANKYFDPEKLFLIMKMNNFHGYLIDISAKTKPLVPSEEHNLVHQDINHFTTLQVM